VGEGLRVKGLRSKVEDLRFGGKGSEFVVMGFRFRI
jgi:hypothetical protein